MNYKSKNYVKYTHPNSIFQYAISVFFREFYSLFTLTDANSVLEVGCGEGFVLDYLAKRNIDLKFYGIDVNYSALNTAQNISAPIIDYVCADGFQIPYADNTFDVVLLPEIIEHVSDPEKILLESIRVSSFYILVTVPREPYFQKIADFFVKWNLADDPDHIQFWTSRELKKWLNSYVRIVSYETCHFYQLALCEKIL